MTNTLPHTLAIPAPGDGEPAIMPVRTDARS